MQQLSAGIQERADGGADIEEIRKYSQSVVETQLIPDYYEFKRQLRPERLGVAGRVLDVAGRISEIDSAFWTPKFYGDFVKAIGAGVLGELSGKDGLTNKAQAYKFIRTLEGHKLLKDD